MRPALVTLYKIQTTVACLTLISILQAHAFADEVPEKKTWELKMKRSGHKWGEYLNPAAGHTLDKRLGTQYYDAQWVFYQISDYTKEKEPWSTYAAYAKQAYRDEYLIPNDFKAQGYRRFAEGLYEDFRRGGDTKIEHLVLLRDRPAYSTVRELSRGLKNRSGYSQIRSREVAFAVTACVISERAGSDRVSQPSGKSRLRALISMMENHFWEWRTQTFADPGTGRVAPFMLGLSSYALIDFYDWEITNRRDPNQYWPKSHWPTIDAALTDVFDWLYHEATVVGGKEFEDEKMWYPKFKGSNYGTFRFMDRTHAGSGSPTATADVNQLIAPTYYWLFKITGNLKYRDIGDQLFASAALHGAAHWSGKHFNQLYRLSFKSLEWRGEKNKLLNN